MSEFIGVLLACTTFVVTLFVVSTVSDRFKARRHRSRILLAVPSEGYARLSDIAAASGLPTHDLWSTLFKLQADGLITARWAPGESGAVTREFRRETA